MYSYIIMAGNQRNRPKYVELVTKSGDSLSLALDSKLFLEAQLEAGEFFYEVSHIMSSVRCEKCGHVGYETLTKGTCLIEDWDLEPWADCETYRLRTGCRNCGSDLQADLLATWYNYEVRFAGQKTKNCSLIGKTKQHFHATSSVKTA